MSMISNPKLSLLLFLSVGCKSVIANSVCPSLLQPTSHGKGMKWKVKNQSPINQQIITCFLLHLVFHFGLLLKVLLNYVQWFWSDYSYYTCLHALSIKLYRYPSHYGHIMDMCVAEFKRSWITLLICYQYLFTSSIPQSTAAQLYLEKVMLELYFRASQLRGLCYSSAMIVFLS